MTDETRVLYEVDGDTLIDIIRTAAKRLEADISSGAIAPDDANLLQICANKENLDILCEKLSEYVFIRPNDACQGVMYLKKDMLGQPILLKEDPMVDLMNFRVMKLSKDETAGADNLPIEFDPETGELLVGLTKNMDVSTDWETPAQAIAAIHEIVAFVERVTTYSFGLVVYIPEKYVNLFDEYVEWIISSKLKIKTGLMRIDGVRVTIVGMKTYDRPSVVAYREDSPYISYKHICFARHLYSTQEQREISEELEIPIVTAQQNATEESE